MSFWQNYIQCQEVKSICPSPSTFPDTLPEVNSFWVAHQTTLASLLLCSPRLHLQSLGVGGQPSVILFGNYALKLSENLILWQVLSSWFLIRMRTT